MSCVLCRSNIYSAGGKNKRTHRLIHSAKVNWWQLMKYVWKCGFELLWLIKDTQTFEVGLTKWRSSVHTKTNCLEMEAVSDSSCIRLLWSKNTLLQIMKWDQKKPIEVTWIWGPDDCQSRPTGDIWDVILERGLGTDSGLAGEVTSVSCLGAKAVIENGRVEL